LVCEDPSHASDNWVQREPQTGTLYDDWYCYNLTLPAGAEYGGYNFGNFQYGSAFVNKYEDLDGVLGRSDDETWLGDPSFTFRLYFDDVGGWNQVSQEDTNGSGLASFTGNLTQLGQYYVCEVYKDGWQEMRSLFNPANNQSGAQDEYPVCEGITVSTSGYRVSTEFGNIRFGDLVVTKYNDVNGNGEWDDNEDTLPDWTMNLSGFDFLGSQDTDVLGEATFSDLRYGKYYLSETEQDGWTQTGISCSSDEQQEDRVFQVALFISDTPDGYGVGINAGETTTCYVGNQAEPILTIEKSNDAIGNKNPGETVTYTLKLNLTGSDIQGVTVTDITPDGFEYVPGSWTAKKNGVPFVILEPSYGSPGVWNIGDLLAGDEVVLTYEAKISTDQDGGTYKDIAWASGMNEAWGVLLAQGQNSTYVDDVYVGTDVTVNENMLETGSVDIENTGEVLGASTELPATGANSGWLALALALLVSGLLFIFGGKRMKMFLVGIVAISALFPFAPRIEAADPDNNLSVRVEQPVSPTRLSSWKLSFSVLDREARTPVVTCFAKKPGAGSFVQFDTAKTSLKDLGDNDSCDVNSSLLTAQGDYEFYVHAVAGGDSEDSDHVTVAYDTQGPERPVSFSKERPWACRYVIHFKTAADNGNTKSVEIFGSKDRSFNTDNSTRLGGVSIGSDEEGTYNFDMVGDDCNEEWYFVIRAFDSVGNQSAHIGDEVDLTTTVTPSPAAGALLVDANQGGSVLGEETPTDSTGTGEVMGTEASPSPDQGMVAGLKEAVSSGKLKWWLLGGVIVIILGYAYARKNKQA